MKKFAAVSYKSFMHVHSVNQSALKLFSLFFFLLFHFMLFSVETELTFLANTHTHTYTYTHTHTHTHTHTMDGYFHHTHGWKTVHTSALETGYANSLGGPVISEKKMSQKWSNYVDDLYCTIYHILLKKKLFVHHGYTNW